MKIIFIGTRANIKHRSEEHWHNASCLVSYRKTTIMIDCGLDWLGEIGDIKIDGIFITHAHEDHVGGLANGASSTVFLTKESAEVIKKYPIRRKYIVKLRKPVVIGDLVVEAFPVEHALNAPAVGYRISTHSIRPDGLLRANGVSIFYVPDLVFIRQQKAALKNIDLYIGDGARVSYPLIRKSYYAKASKDRENGRQMGHTTIINQLEWCKRDKVPRAIFTHCGTEIVTSDPKELNKKIKALGKEQGVKASIAYDGLEITV